MRNSDTDLLKSLLNAPTWGLSESACELVLRYYELLRQENENQNLTRLISPQDFFEGHFLDCFYAEKSALIGPMAIDLGSGGGVPGLLMACIEPKRKWILCESERGKADFLSNAVEELGLSERVDVFYGRIETLLSKASADTIVARAVGTASKILAWISSCSTWNKLVLFKGPKWQEELEELKRSRFKPLAREIDSFSYTVGELGKQRVLIALTRVPRGTK